jgi:hypothetical protein
MGLLAACKGCGSAPAGPTEATPVVAQEVVDAGGRLVMAELTGLPAPLNANDTTALREALA